MIVLYEKQPLQRKLKKYMIVFEEYRKVCTDRRK